MSCYTVYCEEHTFKNVGCVVDKEYAEEIAHQTSLTNKQSLIYILDDEKEVIAVVFRGLTYVLKSQRGGEV